MSVQSAQDLMVDMFKLFDGHDMAEVMSALSLAAVMFYAGRGASRKEFVRDMGLVWDKCPASRACVSPDSESA